MKMQKRVAVFGCGKVGLLVTRLLAQSGDYAVTAVDSDPSAAQRAILGPGNKPFPNCQTATADFFHVESITQALTGADYVLSCAPYQCNAIIAPIARNLGVHYFDLTEDVENTKMVKDLARDSELTFMPQCGLAPGFISIVANSLAAEFDKVETIKMRVGALPLYPHNALKYNLTWSTDGLINEYGNPCEAVVNGKPTHVPPLEGLERLSLDGVEYEAFNTSGGLGTLWETYQGRARNIDYKSIRYPGHRDIVALLMNDLKLNENRAVLKAVFEAALPHTHQDVVLIFVTTTGWRGERYSQKSYAKKIYSVEILGELWGAIQVTTAAGLTAALDLHATGKLPKKGFVKQEDIPLADFLNNRFGKYYA